MRSTRLGNVPLEARCIPQNCIIAQWNQYYLRWYYTAKFHVHNEANWAYYKSTFIAGTRTCILQNRSIT